MKKLPHTHLAPPALRSRGPLSSTLARFLRSGWLSSGWLCLGWLVFALGCPPATTVDAGDGDGDGDGDLTDAGDGDGDGDLTDAGDGDGDGDVDAGGEVPDCETECTDLVYTECTCGAADPCGWAGDDYCDDACGQVVADPFDDLGDCGPPAPEGWVRCAADWYDADDGCDCGCGVPDPDCPNPGIEVCNFFYCGDDPVDPDDNGSCVSGDLNGDPPPADVFVDGGANAPISNLDADSDRDGVVTAADDAVEAAWSVTSGAAVIMNLDDDDGTTGRDQADLSLSGASDVADLSPILLRSEPNLDDTYEARLVVRPNNAAARTHIFLMDDLTGTAGEMIHFGRVEPVVLDNALLRTGDVRLMVEATAPRNAFWDGNFTVRLEYHNAEGLVSVDEVAMRVAPVIFPDNLQTPRTLHVMRLTDGMNANPGFWDPLSVGLPNQSIELYEVDQQAWQFDRWTQDNMQTGYQMLPGENAIPHVMETHINTQRPGGLNFLLPRELTGADLGYVWPGGNDTSHNYGGNIEVFPPYQNGADDYPVGRVMAGGGEGGSIMGIANTDRMNPEQTAFFNAQEIQSPLVEVSSEWLIVGHIDEIFQVVPDLSATPGLGFKVMFASPALAVQVLEDAATAGDGAANIFTGRATYQTTVTEMLADDDLMAYQASVQSRIDSVRQVFIDTFGITDADVIEVPVLYEFEQLGPLDLSVALNPGVQNLITAADTLYAPDPEGPIIDGVDAWQTQVLASVQPTGLNVEFVDVFHSYHVLLGEAHCGSNMTRDPYDTPWWEIP